MESVITPLIGLFFSDYPIGSDRQSEHFHLLLLPKNFKRNNWERLHRLASEFDNLCQFSARAFCAGLDVCQREHLAAGSFARFFQKSRRAGGMGVQIVSSGPDTPPNAIKDGLLEMLYAARRYVYIQTPYFSPDESFLETMRIAVDAGVDVRLMVPSLENHAFARSASYSYAQQAFETGVKIFRYKGFIHAKTMVYDDEVATGGTANIGNRSFSLNFEVNVFVYDKNFAARCAPVFLDDQANSSALTADWFAGRSRLTRGAYGVCRLLAPLI